MFDSHIHTNHSSDCRQAAEEIFQTAIARGFCGVAITDHANVAVYERLNIHERIAASVAEAQAADRRYAGKLRVLKGAEIDEPLEDPAATAAILAITDYDVVLSSCHKVNFEDWSAYFSGISFAAPAPEEKLHGFLAAYFRDLQRNAAEADYDVLCHLTVPLRYINGKYGRGVSLTPHAAAIDRILKTVIEREKALEVNTSGVGSVLNETMPDTAVLQRYFALGGRRITLGSDAHVAQNVGNGFRETITVLKAIGFTGVSHYEHRREVLESWEKAEQGLKL